MPLTSQSSRSSAMAVWMGGVVNCAHCADYACDKLEQFFGFVPPARTVLDEIRLSVE
jgi:hypothetical protein